MTQSNVRAILWHMSKGDDKKNSILDAGLDMASRLGLEGVSIGALAKANKMSKSGLFAHFQSKENLQIDLLMHAGQLFAESVIIPALRIEAGIPRIRALVDNWVNWAAKLTGGCIFVSASTEFSDRPGRVRDYLIKQQEDWIECLSRIGESAIKVSVFPEDVDCRQFAFDLYSLMLGFHFYRKLLQDTETKTYQEQALNRLLANYQGI